MKTDTCTCTVDCDLGFNPFCECTHEECDCRNIAGMIGADKAQLYEELNAYIDERYDMVKGWKRRMRTKTVKWEYEYKYTRDYKILCRFLVADNCLGFMIIFGQRERQLIEANRADFSKAFLDVYDETPTHKTGKRVLMELEDRSFFEDIKKVLNVKRTPNRK